MRVILAITFTSYAMSSFALAAPVLEAHPEGGDAGETANIVARAGTKAPFDCTKKATICANICFAANCGKKPGVSLAEECGNKGTDSTGDLTYSPGANKNNRVASGFNFAKTKAGEAALTKAGVDKGGPTDTSLDEFPPASTTKGGDGAVLKYVPLDEQKSQGGQTYKNAKSPLHYYELQNWRYSVSLNLEFLSFILTILHSGIPECDALQAGDISGCKTDKAQFHYIASSKSFAIGA